MANSDRKPYLTATVLDQDLLDNCQDNLVIDLEMVVEIESPKLGETFYLSDRNKYIGSTFYEARLKFPVIKRTIGEILSPSLTFSSLRLEINNADGKFNRVLPSGDDYDGWIGNTVKVKMGLRDILSTYTTIFEGTVSPVGGFQRTTKSFILVVRDKFEEINKTFPVETLKLVDVPNLEPTYDNAVIPYIYGDWTVKVETGAASVITIPANGNDPNVNGVTGFTENVSVVISENANTVFDSTEVYIRRGDFFYKFDSADIVNVSANKNSFQVRQSGTSPAGTTTIDGDPYEFNLGDQFLVKVKGKDLGSGGIYDANIVSIARDILETFSGLTSPDFDSSWDTVRDKTIAGPNFDPPQDAIKGILARAWLQEPQETFDYVLQLLEQVRVEPFINRDQKLALRTLHFEDFDGSPSFKLRNWDVERPTFKPKLDDRTNINRAKAVYNFLPNRKENFEETSLFRNDAAIAQSGVEVSKKIVFPNLYSQGDVENQLVDLLRLVSSTPENIYVNATWRALLLDIGDFILVRIEIQGTVFEDVPCLVREIGYDPNGNKMPLRLWSFQMTPFPGNLLTGTSGIIGGYNQAITEE